MTDRAAELLDAAIGDARAWAARSGPSLARIWVDVTVRPWVGFRRHVRPRDQSRAVVFAMGIVAAWLALRAVFGTLEHPVVGDLRWLSLVLWVVFLLLVVTPVAIHLLGAVVTLLLVVLAPARSGVSETVQVIAYAMAPAVFIAIPITGVQAAAGLYASIVLAVGMIVIHRLTIERGLVVAAVPAYALFMYGFGADDAIITILRAWYII